MKWGMHKFNKLLLLFITVFGLVIISKGQEVILEKIENNYFVPCKINGSESKFIYNKDIEQEAFISLSEATALLDSGILIKSDFKNCFKDDTTKEIIPAGAEVVLSIIEIGDQSIYNTHAIVVENAEASIILGEKAFKKTGEVIVDYESDKFRFEEKKFVNTYGVKYMCASGNCMNGYGSYLYDNGAVYMGEFKDGDMMGHGIYFYEDGEKYIGNFKYGEYEGEGASIKTDGAKYIGEFSGGEFNGFGRLYFSSGKKYTGHFVEGVKEGYGIYEFTNGQKYMGYFSGDSYNGKGKMIFSNGAEYSGDFVDNKREGFGIYTSPSGLKYTGEFKDGAFNGKGTLIQKDGTVQTGNFVNGEFTGE